MLRVWMPQPPAGTFLPALEAALPAGIEFVSGADAPAGPVHILVGGNPDEALLEAHPGLHTLIIPYAGLPARTRALLAAHPHVAVHNLHHNAAPTAEMAITLMLAAAKHVVPFDAALRQGDWRPRYAPPRARTLAGLTALVLGYGAVGRRVAHACAALGMQVEAVRRRAGGEDPASGTRIHTVEQLDACLPRADVVHVCLPATEATEGLLDGRRLALLPKGAILVNVGRGSIVAEDALYDALHTGRLGAAGLDVWYAYPGRDGDRAHTLPATRPFHELENVVLSPHRAGLTQENEAARAACLAVLLHQAARGTPLDNPVDLAAGY
jgi:phosphoglycerate dehydrogenase-like enzyme